ncbi:MAG: 1-phosphofructokinase family hexose kinase [Rhodobacteraceae bacterium]|nr:1-phosphofructokinase family hexose kinase [Paracoccaceae bacterium]
MSASNRSSGQAQAPIVTLTLNPALDVAAEADKVVPGPKLRVSEPVIEPGGGGINVARAIGRLGGQALAIAALGGLSGDRLAQLMRAGGHALEVFAIEGETRQSITVTDRSDGGQYRFVLPGPHWAEGQAHTLLDALGDRLAEGALVVLSGSQPPGLPAAFPGDVARLAVARGVRLLVDTSGPALARLIDTPSRARPFLLRLDEGEAGKQAGGALTSAAQAGELAGALVARGVASVVVVARGAEGSVLVGEGLRLSCSPPSVSVKSKVGAGDSFTGGFVLALARGEGLEAALLLGTAAAAAAVMTGSTELCRAEDVARIAPQCRVEAL